MTDYILIDPTRNAKAIKKERCWIVASKILLFHGFSTFNDYPDRIISEYWTYTDEMYPGPDTLNSYIDIKGLLGFLHHRVSLKHRVWNQNFLRGLTKIGRVRYSPTYPPALVWKSNIQLLKIFSVSPFYNYIQSLEENYYRASGLAPLCMKYDESSMSYLAGLLASGQPVMSGKYLYAKYSHKLINIFLNLGIPIEGRIGKAFGGNEDIKSIVISPFWPALLTPYMPQEVRNHWLNIENGYNNSLYAAILFRTYRGRDFVAGAIPYLDSRKFWELRFKTRKEMTQFIRQKRLESGLLQLDTRFKILVQNWETEQKNIDFCKDPVIVEVEERQKPMGDY